VSLFWAALAAAVAVLAVLAAVLWLAWRLSGPESRDLVRRVGRLPFRRKLALALALLRDRRVPLAVRAVPPALVLYLAMPLDVIPDFIPVIGHLDDALVFALAAAVMVRFTPPRVIEEQLSRLEEEVRGS
jgi:uncharacterized membrane protein YkvA (DUF1232 family)